MRRLISVLAVAMTLTAGATRAADLPSRKGPPPVYVPPPVFTWTGFYVGVNIGGGWRDHRSDDGLALVPIFFLPTTNNSNFGGVVGGGQSGFNYQFSPLFVVGLEEDFQGASIGSGGGGGGFGLNERITYFGTVRGRIGITPFDPHFLVYGTGGFAYGEVREDGIFFQSREIKTGWTAGGGVEWAFLPNWSAKVEYLYTDLNSNNGGFFGFGDHPRTRFHTVRAGLNYHFDLFGLFRSSSVPVVAKY